MSKSAAIATGGASGIGLATSVHLLGHGYRVVVPDLNEPAAYSDLVPHLQGSDCITYRCDILDYVQLKSLFRTAFAWGSDRLDLFVANAGIGDWMKLEFQAFCNQDNRGEFGVSATRPVAV